MLPTLQIVVMPETLILQIKILTVGSKRKAGRPVGDAWIRLEESRTQILVAAEDSG